MLEDDLIKGLAGVLALSPIFLVIVAFLHDAREEDFVKSGDTFYSWMYYECIDGVMYRQGRSYTLVVNSDGTPKQCKIVKMTNGEYNNIGK